MRAIKRERISLVILILMVTAIALLPSFAYAAPFDFSGTIVPEMCKCEQIVTPGGQMTTAPAYGCVLQTLQNVIRFVFAFAFLVATLAFIYAGFIFMTSGANSGKREQGKNLLLNVMLGIGIMLAAWLIVDFVMKTIYNDETGGFGPWNNILAANGASACIMPTESRAITSGALDIVRGRPVPEDGVQNPIQGTDNCPDCVPLTGFACKESRSCTVNPAFRDRLTRLVQTFRGDWIVTEAYPPTRTHAAACHRQGTCIDAAFRGNTRWTAENIRAFAQAAAQAGLRVVFETAESGRCPLRDSARAIGVEAYCRSDGGGYEGITGNHFSVYSN